MTPPRFLSVLDGFSFYPSSIMMPQIEQVKIVSYNGVFIGIMFGYNL